MKLKRCENLHYYDGDIYSVCPHCLETNGNGNNNSVNNNLNSGANISVGDTDEMRITNENVQNYYGRDPAANSAPVRAYAQWQGGNAAGGSGYNFGANNAGVGAFAQAGTEDEDEISPTPLPHNFTPQQKPSEIKEPFSSVKTDGNAGGNINENGGKEISFEGSEISEAEHEDELQVNGFTGALNAARKKAMERSGGNKSPATIIFSDTQELVFGWLVVISKEQKGKIYALNNIKSTIGRGDVDNIVDVDIHYDRSVSRGSQAVLVYDRINKKFLFQNTNGKTVVYLNKKVVMTYEELNPYDIIQLGDTELLFVPLCTEKFSW